MGFIIKQNKAISIEVMLALIAQFKQEILGAVVGSWERHKLCMALCYSVICFHASLRGSEGLQVDWHTLMDHMEKGRVQEGMTPAHIIIPVKGRFKGEKGERCHLLPLADISRSGVNIRKCVELLVASRREGRVNALWAFAGREGRKLEFGKMNEMILDQLEEIQTRDTEDVLKLKEVNIREEYSINRSFRRGSATHAQNCKVPSNVIEVQNRWRKFERAKGSRPKVKMIETYADVEQLIPTLVQYSAML